MSKRSRRERAEADQLRRLLLLGGGATALAAVGAAWLVTRPATFPVLSGSGSLSDRLGQVGPSPHHQQLTGSGADLLVISDTGCAFCRDFVRTGLDPLIRFAERNGLAAAYLSVGFGRSGLFSTIAAACLEREGSRLSGPDRVRALFDLTEGGTPEGALPEDVIGAAASGLGASRFALGRCVPEESLTFRDRFEATRRLFELERTPTFYLSAPGGTGRILKLEGFTTAGAMTGRLERALEAGGRS